MKPTTTRIALLDHVGYGNLGDEATITVVYESIKERCPEAEFIGITFNPPETERNLGIRTYPIHRNCKVPINRTVSTSTLKSRLQRFPVLKGILRGIKWLFFRMPVSAVKESFYILECYRALEGVDVLVIAGGGQLRDAAGGPYDFPGNIFRWVGLARFRGARCLFLNQGAGPLKSRRGKFLVRRSLELGTYASFRDQKSKDMIRTIGFTKAAEVRPDCVYNWSRFQDGGIIPRQPSARLAVGISPMRVYWDSDSNVYARQIKELGKFGRWLAEEGHNLCLFSTENPSDDEPIADLASSIGERGAEVRWDCPKIDDLDSLLRCMTKLDYVLTCRFHGVVFAHLMKIPVIAIAHHPKVTTLMQDIGLSEYCIDFNQFDAERLREVFGKVVERNAAIKRDMSQKADMFRRELALQFDRLFPLCAPHQGYESGVPLDLTYSK